MEREDRRMDRDQARALLGLNEGASDAEIKRAYRDLMRTVHPDKLGGDPAAARLAVLANEAKDVLLAATEVRPPRPPWDEAEDSRGEDSRSYDSGRPWDEAPEEEPERPTREEDPFRATPGGPPGRDPSAGTARAHPQPARRPERPGGISRAAAFAVLAAIALTPVWLTRLADRPAPTPETAGSSTTAQLELPPPSLPSAVQQARPPLSPEQGAALLREQGWSDDRIRSTFTARGIPLPTGLVFRDCPTCPEMVVIPAGKFLMDSPASDEGHESDEGPQHQVTVSSFALGRYEVTRDEYRAFAEATGHPSGGCRIFDSDEVRWIYDEDASWREPGFAQGSGHPAVCVNWNDAQTYARWLSREMGESYRLPSESEWEYAARAATTTRWYWGDAPASQCRHANGADAAHGVYAWAACNDGAVHTAMVGSYSANAFGLFDMAGNVWEWVEDCWNTDYASAPNCSRRVLRGGSWDSTPGFLRSAAREWTSAESRLYYVGFRVARTLD